MTALALVEKSGPEGWTTEDIDLVKKTICPAGIPDAEFKLFIRKCQASGMNPLLGECFCIKRNVNAGNKEKPNWIAQYVFQTAEQGMEARADQFEDFEGIRAAAVYEKDLCNIDPSKGEVIHTFDPTKERGRLLGAWAIAFRRGRKTPLEWLLFSEYTNGLNPQWAMRPATMMVKCARAAALRRTYPNKFSDVYAPEELDREEGKQVATETQIVEANKPTTDKLVEKLAAQNAQNAVVPVIQASAQTVEVSFVKQANQAAEDAADEKATKPRLVAVDSPSKPVENAGPVMVFGKDAGIEGKPIADLTGVQILEAIGLGEKHIGKAKADKQPLIRQCINDLVAEQKRREKKLLEETGPKTVREPGSDDGDNF